MTHRSIYASSKQGGSVSHHGQMEKPEEEKLGVPGWHCALRHPHHRAYPCLGQCWQET